MFIYDLERVLGENYLHFDFYQLYIVIVGSKGKIILWMKNKNKRKK